MPAPLPDSEPAQETESLLPSEVPSQNSGESDDGDSPRHGDNSLQTSLILRIGAAMFSFAILGITVSTVGVMIPKLEQFYHLTDADVSLIFLTAPLGYLPATYLNLPIHLRLGQRGIATIGPFCHVLWSATTALRPPFPIFLTASAIGFFGAALLDGSWCAWAGGMKSNANTIQGLLHGSFSIGAGLGPLLAGSIIELAQKPWYVWYCMLVAICVVEMVLLSNAFWAQDAKRYHQEKHNDDQGHDGVTITALLRRRVIWICAAYFLAYVAMETTVSGWIVTFMTRSRHASSYLASICSSAFWVGQAVGRLCLGVVTDRIRVKPAVTIYLACAITAMAVFATVYIPSVSVATIALLGFFCGPLYPSGVVTMTQLLPNQLHVAANSLVALVGQTGGALLPFGFGATADMLGIGLFELFVLAELVLAFLVWIMFPKHLHYDSGAPEDVDHEDI